MPDISIIIINWNTRRLLLDCLDSVYKTIQRAAFEVFVVDNGSADGSVDAVAGRFPGVKLIANSRNEGFARANNAAIRRMKGRYAALLNSDTLLKPGAIDDMFAFMETHPDAGMCGPQLLYGDGSKQTSAGVYPDILSELTSKSLARLFSAGKRGISLPPVDGAAPVDFIIGACMFARKNAIDDAGMLDEDYFFFYEEIDWCFRMNRKGWRVYHVPGIEIYHFGGQSTKNINLKARVESWRSRYLFFRKSLHLQGVKAGGVILLGFMQTMLRFAGYTLINVLTLFSLGRPRRRWRMFGYLLVWHLRGLPVSMGLPR
jgi:GT2 family glycosyltransferase